jgi:2-iminobutanoate/2-iminopropanoate deaminase
MGYNPARGDFAMMKKVITLPDAPRLPFSAAIRAGDYIFVSGQIGHTDAEGREIKGVEAQVTQCLENMKKVLAAADTSLDEVVKVTVFLRDENDFGKMNEIYQSYFTKDRPARSTVIACLALPSMLIEIDCIAYSPPKS